jgi:hypothetical protein
MAAHEKLDIPPSLVINGHVLSATVIPLGNGYEVQVVSRRFSAKGESVAVWKGGPAGTYGEISEAQRVAHRLLRCIIATKDSGEPIFAVSRDGASS